MRHTQYYSSSVKEERWCERAGGVLDTSKGNICGGRKVGIAPDMVFDDATRVEGAGKEMKAGVWPSSS
jgi:hypothetical protein